MDGPARTDPFSLMVPMVTLTALAINLLILCIFIYMLYNTRCDIKMEVMLKEITLSLPTLQEGSDGTLLKKKMSDYEHKTRESTPQEARVFLGLLHN